MAIRKTTLAVVLLVGVALAGCSTGGSKGSKNKGLPRSTAAPSTVPSTSPTVPSGMWVPSVGATWQYQLSGKVDTSIDAAVFDIDGFDNSPAVVAALHAKGRRVICYIDAGSWEDWRPDAGQFPESVLGAELDGWPGERWLDIRRIETLKPLMAARFDICKQKGFDAVEPDNVDGYDNESGFALTSADQIAYNTMLADLAHERGLAVGLKNDLDQVDRLVGSFDFAVNEQCFQYAECDVLERFIKAGKPVFHVEYEVATAKFCAATTAMGLSSIRKDLSLEVKRESC